MNFSACNKSESSESVKKAVEFTRAEITLEVGESVQAEVATSKAGVFVFFSMADERIAKINGNGVITAVAEGETICFAEFGGETARCAVKVIPKQAKPMLSVSTPYKDNKLVMYVGSSIDLQLDVKMGDGIVIDVQKSYEVADGQVASVENEKVNALKVGETTITVRVVNGEQTAEITLLIQVVEK